MSSEDEFYVSVWRMVTTMVCTLFLVVGGCTVYRDNLMQDALVKTANPEGVACAFGGQAAQALCLLRAAKAGE